MSNISRSQYDFNLINEALNASSLRSKVIANNIANVNTPGYKGYHVSFEENLKNSMQQLDMKTTDPRHINDASGTGDIQIVQDTGTSMQSDGNNVDIDSEMSNLASNQLTYNALITELNNRLSMTKMVIDNGGKY